MGSRLHAKQMKHGDPIPPTEGDVRSYDLSYAVSLDEKDPLRSFRSEFIIPTKEDLKRSTIAKPADTSSEQESTYLCGNSLGLQPKQTATLISSFLTAWSTKAVTGHFVGHDDAPEIPPFLHVDDYTAGLMAPIVGASKEEVTCMGTLTGNLHLMMSAFYRPPPPKTSSTEAKEPNSGRYKILLEGKAFPSDHFAIESQIRYHGYDPKDAMILMRPEPGTDILSTSQILAAIDEHASTAALVLLPGVQFYTGQYFDIPTITAHAHSKGITVGWDLAHAVGNLPVQLHDWDVDFAVWCSYKYLNSGPGAIAGAFVHSKHGQMDMSVSEPSARYHPRLAGWWGADKTTRFAMENDFIPRTGAAGYQVSNPSALDLTSLTSSLLIFNRASMPALREKSLQLTAYLERLLLEYPRDYPAHVRENFSIITPSDPEQRGAQLSIKLLSPALLEPMLEHLEKEGVVIDERKPDVIRVAPAPLYNSFVDCLNFARIFLEGLKEIIGEAK